MNFLNALARVCFNYINVSIFIGLMLGLMSLLRPLLLRALAPQQRTVLWSVGWLFAYTPGLYFLLSWIKVLPVHFSDLVVPRTGYDYYEWLPAYLPDYYGRPGDYNIVLPVGPAFEVEFTQWMVWGILLLWLVGLIATVVMFGRRERAVKRMIKAGTPIALDAEWLLHFPELKEKQVEVRICEHIPTSFVYRGWVDDGKGECARFTICLQKELPPDQMTFVLRHELNHINLFHCWFKFLSTAGLVIHWFNPIFWLANKYFCQDLELACDRATLKQLTPHQRKEYAHTLVDLAVGPQMWDVPVCFGESDAALRVKEIAVWKLPETTKERAVILGQIAVFGFLFLFFIGGTERTLPQDALLVWQQQGGTSQTLLQEVEDYLSMSHETVDSPIWITDGDAWDDFWLYVQMSDGNWWRLSGDIINWKGSAQFHIIDRELLTEAPDLTGADRIT